MLRKGESGQALVIALIVLAVGVLLVAAFLYYVSASQRASRGAQEAVTDHYTADAGVEHAIWRLTYEPGFTQTVAAGSPVVYTITINGRTVVITVTQVVSP